VLSRNFFFAGTFLVILINIVLFASNFNTLAGSMNVMSNGVQGGYRNWYAAADNWREIFYFEPLLQSFINSFSHADWGHVLFNMLGLLICGFYLERKTGSIRFLLLVLAMTFFTSLAISANFLSVYWHGFSGVVFGLFAYIAVDFLFLLFNKRKRNKVNVFSGLLDIGLIYLVMCLDSEANTIRFTFYPINLANNLAHYTGALTGLVLGLTIQISKIKIIKAQNAIN